MNIADIKFDDIMQQINSGVITPLTQWFMSSAVYLLKWLRDNYRFTFYIDGNTNRMILDLWSDTDFWPAIDNKPITSDQPIDDDTRSAIQMLVNIFLKRPTVAATNAAEATDEKQK